jgi:Arc/MetJ family transcription regulator
MRMTVTIDDELLADAKEFSGIEDTSALVQRALALLVQRDAAQKLISLGGTEPDLKAAPRSRPDDL